MIAAVAIGLCIAIFLLCSYLAYRMVFFSPKADREKIRRLTGEQYTPHRQRMDNVFKAIQERPFEPVTIRSHDGLTLFGRYYHFADGAPLDICFHGYRSCSFIDFSCGSELSFQMGHNVLLVDQRAHGRSQGSTITFGILERQDCLAWANYASERFGPDAKITVYGLSMGGATVLMASSLPLPAAVKGIVADCPFSSPKKIICDVEKKLGYPNGITWFFTVLGAAIFGRFNINALTAADAVKDTRVPILIIHGEADGYVPCDMSEEVCLANPAMVTRHTFPGADHGMSYLVDTPRYHRIIRDFTDSIL